MAFLDQSDGSLYRFFVVEDFISTGKDNPYIKYVGKRATENRVYGEVNSLYDTYDYYKSRQQKYSRFEVTDIKEFENYKSAKAELDSHLNTADIVTHYDTDSESYEVHIFFISCNRYKPVHSGSKLAGREEYTAEKGLKYAFDEEVWVEPTKDKPFIETFPDEFFEQLNYFTIGYIKSPSDEDYEGNFELPPEDSNRRSGVQSFLFKGYDDNFYLYNVSRPQTSVEAIPQETAERIALANDMFNPKTQKSRITFYTSDSEPCTYKQVFNKFMPLNEFLENLPDGNRKRLH